MWLLWLACVHRDLAPAVRASEIAAQADQLWLRRDEIGIDAAGEPLQSATKVFRGGPGVAWRLTRWYVAKGLLAEDPAEAKRFFASGRESAVACLDQNPTFVAWHTAGDWERAGLAVPPVRRACAAWGALAWVRWLQLHGPVAASLDLPAIDALIAAGKLADADNVLPIATWADGLLHALRPEWAGRELDRARRQLDAAVNADPASAVRQIDRYHLVLSAVGTPEEQAAALASIRALVLRYPEEISVRERFLAGLSARGSSDTTTSATAPGSSPLP